MDQTNQTIVTYFIIKGISDVPELKTLIFLLVLLLYILTLSGNLVILLLVCMDQQLHTPMYFFLCNLSILDISSTTVTLHRILIDFISGHNTVSFFGCMAQMYIFTALACDELLILTAMSYDRYVAICNPLRYHMVMNHRVCILLTMVCWLLGFLEILPILWALSNFTCYRSHEINHFFCDMVPLIKLCCNDTSSLEFYIVIEGIFLGSFTPFFLTFISYVFIILTIMNIRCSTGRRKAFYTCSSHLTVVILLYVTLICQYLRPTSIETLESNKLFSLFNTATVPMLNPLIYSLKNKEVKSALGRRLRHAGTSDSASQKNETPITYFIIKGISEVPQLQALVFFLGLLIYLITVGGNMTILVLVCRDSQLHTPMYFFLGNLSMLDVFCLTITLHKILLTFMSGDNTVSFLSCMSQMYIFSSLTCNELLILTAMSYDRYVAICNPLHYHMVMRGRVCVLLAIVCWLLGFIEVIPHMWAISRFSCYKSNEINHYFCDILPIMKLSCSDTTTLKLVIFIEGLFLVSFTPFLLTFISYVFIISTILRIRDSTGRQKAFYTCSSHLTVVSLLYVSLVCQYLRPTSTDTLESNKLFSLFNTAAVPVLNPFIYSLKNKDVKSAVRRQLRWFNRY
ncbi:uncharacterized protein WCC33_014912 [Rhinophrynus dorsalis]